MESHRWIHPVTYSLMAPCLILLAMCIVQTTSARTVRGDLHSHGIKRAEADGSVWSFEDDVEWHKGAGFEVMAVTNHRELVDPSKVAQYSNSSVHGITVLPGAEWTATNVHLLFLFDPRNYSAMYHSSPYCAIWDPAISVQCVTIDLIKVVTTLMHSMGALVILAHHTMTLLDHGDCTYVPSLAELRAIDAFDMLEIINCGVYDVPTAMYASVHDFHATVGTDIHSLRQCAVRHSCMLFETIDDATGMDPSSFDAAYVFDLLAHGRFSTDYDFHDLSILVDEVFDSGKYTLTADTIVAIVSTVIGSMIIVCGSAAIMAVACNECRRRAKKRQAIRELKPPPPDPLHPVIIIDK